MNESNTSTQSKLTEIYPSQEMYEELFEENSRLRAMLTEWFKWSNSIDYLPRQQLEQKTLKLLKYVTIEYDGTNFEDIETLALLCNKVNQVKTIQECGEEKIAILYDEEPPYDAEFVEKGDRVTLVGDEAVIVRS